MGFFLSLFSPSYNRYILLNFAVVLIILLGYSDDVLAQNGIVPRCYFPNQAIALNNYACSLSSLNSACCAIGNACLDNGLCAPGNGEIIRGACTDQTWTSPECPQYCLQADTGGTDLINCQNVTANARDVCCDHTNDCCDTGVGRFRLDSVGTPVTTIRSSAITATRELLSSSATSSFRQTTSTSAPGRSSTASSSTSRTVTATGTPAPASTSSAPDTSSRLSGGAKAGIGVGAALGAIVVLGVIFWLWKRVFARRKGGEEQRRKDASRKTNHTESGLHELSGQGRSELPGERPQEMSSTASQAWELPGGNR